MTIADLAQRLLDQILAADPLEATLIGYRDNDRHLADLSVAADDARAAARAALRSDVEAVDVTVLTDQDVITRDVLLASLDYADDAYAADQLAYTVAAFPVSPSSMMLSYLRMVVATDGAQADDYLARLSELPRYLAQASERLHLGRAAGLTTVAHLVQSAVDQIDKFLADPAGALRIVLPAGWADAARWEQDFADVLERDVVPAFVAYRAALVDGALPTARDEEHCGLVHLPGGAERYRLLARVHTTTDRTPEELHALGLELVGQIHDEFRELGARALGTSDLGEIFERLQTDPALRWQTSQQILDAAEAAVRRAEAVAPQWFGRLPQAVCALEAIPELEADGAPAAYYMQPAMDGSRPGTYYSNVSEPTQRTSFDLESVAYHEAVPGHHFQISLALELPDLPVIRKLSMFTAYVEGWGLYSERLADEMGLYSDDLQRLGMLSADAWRATRLVVDTGIHAFGWSRQRAVDFMTTSTPVAAIEVQAEIDRYIAYPGQALSYMTGRLDILAQRDKARASLGEAFDIREFHDVVLGSGALPLSVLDQLVDRWLGSDTSS
jgi:uncharacterized protein (DUF885 family)